MVGAIREMIAEFWVAGNPDIILQLAGIAQLVEQLLRKQLVGGSSPLSGTTQLFHHYRLPVDPYFIVILGVCRGSCDAIVDL